MSSSATSELRIPADRSYIVVAKRAAAGFASIAGFGVEAVDEVCIAVAQACENAISAVERVTGVGHLRLGFKLEDSQLEVVVRSVCGRNGEPCSPEAPERVTASMAPPTLAGRERLSTSELGLRVMGLFVDDCRYRVDRRTGTLRVRLTKYRVS